MASSRLDRGTSRCCRCAGGDETNSLGWGQGKVSLMWYLRKSSKDKRGWGLLGKRNCRCESTIRRLDSQGESGD